MHKIILLFLGLSLSSTVFAQDWKSYYSHLEETTDGRYIAERLGLFGLLSAEGEVLLPFEKDSLVEKPMAYLRYKSAWSVEKAYRKDLTKVELKHSYSFPKRDSPFWESKKGIPVLTHHDFLVDQKTKSFYFEAEKFDHISAFVGSDRFARASQGDNDYLLDLKNHTKVKEDSITAINYRLPQLIYYNRDSSICYSARTGKKIWAKPYYCNSLQDISAGYWAIGYEENNLQQVDIFDLATETIFSVTDLPDSILADEPRLISILEGNRLFFISSPYSERSKTTFWVTDLKGKVQEVIEADKYGFLQEKAYGPRSAFFFFMRDEQVYLFNSFNGQKTLLPKDIANASSYPTIFYQDKNQIILEKKLRGSEFTAIYYDSYSRAKDVKVTTLKSSAGKVALKQLSQTGETAFFLFIKEGVGIYYYDSGELIPIQEGSKEELKQLSKNGRYWWVNKKEEGCFIYDVLNRENIFFQEKYFEAESLEGRDEIQFVIFEQNRKGQKRKIYLLDEQGKMLKSLNAKKIKKGFGELLKPIQKDSIILMSSGLVIGLNALPFKNIGVQRATSYYHYVEGDQIALAFLRKDESSVVIDFQGEKQFFDKKYVVNSSDELSYSPYIRFSNELTAEAFYINIALGKKTPELKWTRTNLISKKNEQIFRFRSYTTPHPPTVPAKELDFLVLEYEEDGYFFADWYQLPDLGFYKQLKAKREVYKNYWIDINLSTEEFSGAPYDKTGGIFRIGAPKAVETETRHELIYID
ncbi:hypothetical protein SapgrDRAFT_3357 [Saprospira grandis DSM 2844]|uniref:Uncharacterized protein n=1 Tax=Saprospira grandis DSM 2844 TaxID=694433 RepID=J0P535_9BACT|nr:hypothetical protein [Saprospira grandis]EJF54999.1 hypothetical protein SapgrDRAFT_3357 [Saprospira grandis DSM 2844]